MSMYKCMLKDEMPLRLRLSPYIYMHFQLPSRDHFAEFVEILSSKSHVTLNPDGNFNPLVFCHFVFYANFS